jgi:hypothetical protein
MINALQAFSRPDRYFDHLLYFVKGLVNYLQVHHTIPTIIQSRNGTCSSSPS